MKFLTSNGFAPDDCTPAIMVSPAKGAGKVKVGNVEVTPSDVVVGAVRIPVNIRLLATSDPDFITSGTLTSRKVAGRDGDTQPIIQLENPRDKDDVARILAYLAPSAPCGCNLSFSTPEGAVVAWTSVQEPKGNRRNQPLGTRDEILVIIYPGETVVAHIEPADGRGDVENWFLSNNNGVCSGWLTQEQYDATTLEQGTLEPQTGSVGATTTDINGAVDQTVSEGTIEVQ